MKKPFKLEAKDVTLSLVKDTYGPNFKQDLGKNIFYNFCNRFRFYFELFFSCRKTFFYCRMLSSAIFRFFRAFLVNLFLNGQNDTFSGGKNDKNNFLSS